MRFTTQLCHVAGQSPVEREEPSSTVDSGDRAKNCVDYTAEGGAAGIGTTTVLNAGFHVGDHIRAKKAAQNGGYNDVPEYISHMEAFRPRLVATILCWSESRHNGYGHP